MNLKLLLLASLLVNSLLAQNDEAPPMIEAEAAPIMDVPAQSGEKTYEMYDIAKAPSFPDGEQAMMQYISENLEYPALARENGIQGIVVLIFVVGKDGTVTDVNVVKDIGGGCGKEARRMVLAMPKWTPGEANGHPVKVRYTLPVKYKLEGNVLLLPPVELRDEAPPPPPPPPAQFGMVTEEGVWQRISAGALSAKIATGKPARSTPFALKQLNEKAFLAMLAQHFRVKVADAEGKGFKNLGEVSDYFYRAQFAPELYTKEGMRGQYAKFLTDRADFDLNGDGLGKIASLKIPKGWQLVLFSKKDFKGKKLKIDATELEVTISQMSAIINAKDKKILKGNTSVNWEMETGSIKVIMPKGFPGRQ